MASVGTSRDALLDAGSGAVGMSELRPRPRPPFRAGWPVEDEERGLSVDEERLMGHHQLLCLTFVHPV